VLLNATTRRDVSGNVVGVIGVGQDITERKQAEQEKTRVAQELQTFIDTANAPIFGIDAKGRVNEWNNKAAEASALCFALFIQNKCFACTFLCVFAHINPISS